MRENSLGGGPVMPMKRYRPEQIVNLLWQIEVKTANGKTTLPATVAAQAKRPTVPGW
jgi:hypothetical protein